MWSKQLKAEGYKWLGLAWWGKLCDHDHGVRTQSLHSITFCENYHFEKQRACSYL